MIHFSNNLYCTDGIRPEVNKIKLKLFSGIGTIRVYYITFSSNDSDIFDIYPASILKQRAYRKRDHYIIGLAESKKAAINLTSSLIADYVNKMHSMDGIRSYYENEVKW